MFKNLRILSILIGLFNNLSKGDQKMKVGWKTTEFWVSVLSSAVGILVVLGWITPEVQTEVIAAIEKITGGVIAIISIVAYILGRAKVKAAQINSSK